MLIVVALAQVQAEVQELVQVNCKVVANPKLTTSTTTYAATATDGNSCVRMTLITVNVTTAMLKDVDIVVILVASKLFLES